MIQEEENFKSIFSSVSKQKEELKDSNQDNDLSFIDNISFDNLKNNTNTMTYNNINDNNKLEIYNFFIYLFINLNKKFNYLFLFIFFLFVF